MLARSASRMDFSCIVSVSLNSIIVNVKVLYMFAVPFKRFIIVIIFFKKSTSPYFFEKLQNLFFSNSSDERSEVI